MSAIEDKPYTGVLTVVSAATVILATVTATGVGALCAWGQDKEFERKVENRPVRELVEQRTAANARLSSYGWVDREAGTVHIPIDEAKRQLLDELR